MNRQFQPRSLFRLLLDRRTIAIFRKSRQQVWCVLCIVPLVFLYSVLSLASDVPPASQGELKDAYLPRLGAGSSSRGANSREYETTKPQILLSGDGLLGSYYQNPNLTGLAEQRVDAVVQFPGDFSTTTVDTGDTPPGTGLEADDNWSIRWTGHVLIDTTGEWTFHTDSDDGVRLWVDGQQVINNWTTHPLTRNSGKATLDAGWKSIQVEFFQSGPAGRNNRAAIRLSFEGPCQPETVIPQSHLSSSLLSSTDIGSVGHTGSVAIDHAAGQYTISGSGADIQGSADAFHFAYVTFRGDGSLRTRVNSIVDTNRFAKGGLMFRESLLPGSRNVMMEMKSTTGSEFQFRSATYGQTTVGFRDADVHPPCWVRIDRVGDRFTGYYSSDGFNWTEQDSINIDMPETLFVGLAVTAHNNAATTKAVFDNLSIAGVLQLPEEPSAPSTEVTGFISLLNSNTFDPLTNDGQDPAGFYSDDDEFYTFRGDRFDVNAAANGPGHDEDEGKSASDDDVVFRLTGDGLLHILGVPDNGQAEPFGYISTEDNYRNYHLSLEYKWGVEKFKPRDQAKRDSGLLYHVVGPDLVWTTDVETQIQEGDTGDFFFLGESVSLGSSEATVTVASGANRYQPAGERIDSDGGLTKSRTVDSRTDWNRVEVIVEGDSVTAIVNGLVVNRATRMRRKEGSVVVPLTEGKIALQSEGAEIFYRNVEIKPTHAVGGWHDYKLLVFQETAGADDREVTCIQAAARAIEELAKENRFTVDIVNDSAGVFTDVHLSQYAAVVWNGTSGDVLDASEQAAFKRYIQSGGGFVGIHGAANTELDWPWYGELVGARFANRTSPHLAKLRVDAEAHAGAGGPQLKHPAADGLPEAGWQRVDQWISYDSNPRGKVNVLLTVDESTYNDSGGQPTSDDHPIAWWRDFDGGRSFYSGLGHRAETYSEPLYLQHLLGGIEYAAGVSRVAPHGAIVLFDGTSADAFEKVKGGGPVGWQIDEDGNLAIVPGAGSIRTKQGFTDYRLHLEFKIPATPPGTAEQRRGNSGVYLHNSYELQMLDSYGDANFDARHAGSIYNVKEADANAALPAETWQVYDVQFTAPKFDAQGEKTASARITAYLNGVLIHDDVEVGEVTNGGQPEAVGPQSFFLQDHDNNSQLKFRNIWIQPTTQRPELLGDHKQSRSSVLVSPSLSKRVVYPIQ